MAEERPHTFPNLDWETRNTIAAVIEQETAKREAAEARVADLEASIGRIYNTRTERDKVLAECLRARPDLVTTALASKGQSAK